MSLRRMAVTGLLLAGAAAPLAAQLGQRVFVYYDLQADTVLATRPGADLVMNLIATDNYGYGVDSFALRMSFDASKLTFVSAATQCPDSTPLNVSGGAGFVVISAPSCNASYYYQSIAHLTFRMLPGVTDGTIAGLQPLALIDQGGYDRLLDAGGDFVQICHASGIWGDIDGDAAINSRDALIALSNAVGIPTGGFVVARGDVDADGNVTSRDALAMLSASIGLSVTGFRVGAGIADACAPQPTFPRPLYFVRNSPSAGVAGVSGLAIRAVNDSAVTIPGDSADAALGYMWRPRVSPDGSSVLFICWDASGYPVVCKADAAGGNLTRLTSFGTYQSPDWSPAGDSIVYVNSNQMWVMGADGSNPHPAGGVGTITSVAWRPSSRDIAYTTSDFNGQVHVWNLDTGADAVRFDPATIPNTYTPRFVDWNAAGDSILFDLSMASSSTVASVPQGGGPLTVLVSLQSGAYHPVSTDLGVFFVGYWGGWYRLLLAKSDGTFAIVSHDTEQNWAPGMKRQ